MDHENWYSVSREASHCLFADKRSESMTEQLRCACGVFAKIEAALERIRQNRRPDQHKLYYAFADGVLALENSDHRVVDLAICRVPAAIIELADKVSPPKPKTRGRRIGDKLENNGNEWIVVGLQDGNWWKVIKIGDGESRRIGGDAEAWHNLTIAGEK